MADGGAPREAQAQLGHRGPQLHVRLFVHEADVAFEAVVDLGTSEGTYCRVSWPQPPVTLRLRTERSSLKSTLLGLRDGSVAIATDRVRCPAGSNMFFIWGPPSLVANVYGGTLSPEVKRMSGDAV
jgi:hypothetical protein